MRITKRRIDMITAALRDVGGLTYCAAKRA